MGILDDLHRMGVTNEKVAAAVLPPAKVDDVDPAAAMAEVYPDQIRKGIVADDRLEALRNLAAREAFSESTVNTKPRKPTAGLEVSLLVPADTATLPQWHNALANVVSELRSAMKWPAMNSAHEGYAVLLEEVDELWDQVKIKQGNRDLDKMRHEAIQVAAMAIRFILDVCNPVVVQR